MAMLISSDLMRHLAVYVEPPAQLCLIRVLGSDNEYVFRVRYGDAHLDYPFVVPLFDSASQVEQSVNWDEVRKALAVMSAMVVPPQARTSFERASYMNIYAPQILAPMPAEQFHYWQSGA